jgi:hypothetical protein
VVQDVWYFREKAGMAELLGAETRTTQTNAKTAQKATKLSLRTFLLFTMTLQIRLSCEAALLAPTEFVRLYVTRLKAYEQ